jgi:hypothetical protein
MARKSSKKGKGSYAAYKTENRGYKNKVAKLERHCKKFPKDEEGKKSLERLHDPKNYTPRSKPINPGSNKPQVRTYSFNPVPGYLHMPKTAGEQLSELLGIPLRRTTKPRKGKAPITYKKKRNVKKS